MYYLNGIVSDKEVFGEDFFYGYSVFETIYGRKGSLIFLNEHIERLKKSMDILEIRIENDILLEINKFLMAHANYEEFYLKVQVSRTNFYMKLEEFSGRYFEFGIKCQMIEKIYQNELGFLKSANYLGNIIARRELIGFEGIFINRKNIVTEGTISNLFFVKEGIIYTPSLDLNILEGITRNKIIEICKKVGIKVQEGHFGIEDIREAEGIFFTNSLMKKGLIWVAEFENIPKIKTSEIHKLEKEYLKILNDMI